MDEYGYLGVLLLLYGFFQICLMFKLWDMCDNVKKLVELHNKSVEIDMGNEEVQKEEIAQAEEEKRERISNAVGTIVKCVLLIGAIIFVLSLVF